MSGLRNLDLENQIREENLLEKEWVWRQHYRERQAAMVVWSHQWAHPATGEGSETISTFYVHRDPPMPDEIETDEEFSL